MPPFPAARRSFYRRRRSMHRTEVVVSPSNNASNGKKIVRQGDERKFIATPSADLCTATGWFFREPRPQLLPGWKCCVTAKWFTLRSVPCARKRWIIELEGRSSLLLLVITASRFGNEFEWMKCCTYLSVSVSCYWVPCEPAWICKLIYRSTHGWLIQSYFCTTLTIYMERTAHLRRVVRIGLKNNVNNNFRSCI